MQYCTTVLQVVTTVGNLVSVHGISVLFLTTAYESTKEINKKFTEEQFTENLFFWYYSNIFKKPICTYENFLSPKIAQ